MKTLHKNEETNLTLMEAVENLSNIAEMEVDKHIGVAEKHQLILQNHKFLYQKVLWLDEDNVNDSILALKGVFKYILSYLRQIYGNDYVEIKDEKTMEGIKNIMVLVGEAAKKLDKVTQLFQPTHQQSVMELKEYKDLEGFYTRKISHKIDEGILSKWILALTQRPIKHRHHHKPVKFIGNATKQTKHIFIDLEGVKKDTEYELFFLRKEDGTRFFSPRLIRNMKLICDFGSNFGKVKEDDPLIDIPIWLDRLLQIKASLILQSVKNLGEKFYKECSRHKDHDLVIFLNKTLMSLMLATSHYNLLRNSPSKSCAEYFSDFIKFLRETLHSREYQKLIAYPPKKTNGLAHSLLNLIHGLCFRLYVASSGYQDVLAPILHLIEEANQNIASEHREEANHSHQIWSRLAADYTAMSKLIKRHPTGPLEKTLAFLQEGTILNFDPIAQLNLPSEYYFLKVGDSKIMNLRLPSPIHQEYIHKATVNEEFKGFLRSLESNASVNRLLIFNLQDRTSWKEYFRSVVLEQLQYQENFEKYLTIVTLPKDTEFYHQLPPYHDENHAEVFIKNLKEQLADESGGFYLPEKLRKGLSHKFMDKVISAIHEIFFSGKNVLLRQNRLDFIEILYLFIELKVLELVNPDMLSFTCKDAVDVGTACSVELYVFTKLLNHEDLTENDYTLLNQILYAPSIIVRERIMLSERFNRMVSVIKLIEQTKLETGRDEFSKKIKEKTGFLFDQKF